MEGRGGEGQQEQGLGLVLWSFEVPPQRLGISWAGSGVPSMSLPDLPSIFPFLSFFLNTCLFWLSWVLVATHRIFDLSCSMHTL